jgi:hypothetical protein
MMDQQVSFFFLFLFLQLIRVLIYKEGTRRNPSMFELPSNHDPPSTALVVLQNVVRPMPIRSVALDFMALISKA